MIRKYRWLLILALAAVGAGLFFLERFYFRGVRALEAFSASYERYDLAVEAFSERRTADAERTADEALLDLEARAALRLSSLIKNDAEFMGQGPVVARLSGRELASLKACLRAEQVQSGELEARLNERRALTGQRKEAYARFRGLFEKGSDP